MAEKYIRLDKQGRVATITIDREERRNSITFEMFGELIRAFDELSEADDVRAIVLRGAGRKVFSTGADVTRLTGKSDDVSRHGGDQLTALGKAIVSCDKPVMTMIYGYCFGGAVGLISSCDMRYAADTAKFSIPAAKLGIVYPVGPCRDINALIGPGNLSEMLFTARRYNAAEARDMGLINRVYPEDELEDSVMKTAEQIADNAPLSVSGAKKIINHFKDDPELKRTEEMDRLVGGSFLTRDFQEGLKSFVEKRKAEFIGK